MYCVRDVAFFGDGFLYCVEAGSAQIRSGGRKWGARSVAGFGIRDILAQRWGDVREIERKWGFVGEQFRKRGENDRNLGTKCGKVVRSDKNWGEAEEAETRSSSQKDGAARR